MKLAEPYFTVSNINNFKLNTPDLIREYTKGMFIFKRRTI